MLLSSGYPKLLSAALMVLATLNEKPYWGLFAKTLFVLARNLFKLILMAAITPAPSEHLSPHPVEIPRYPLPLSAPLPHRLRMIPFPDYLHFTQ